MIGKEIDSKFQKIKKNDPIDLADFFRDRPLAEYWDFLCRVTRGTKPLFFWSIIAALFVIISFMVAVTSTVKTMLMKDEVHAENSKLPTNIPTIKDSSLQTNLLKEKDREIETLKNNNRTLKEELDRKPDYITCIEYGTNLSELRSKKEETENRIQSLLNPVMPKEYADQGRYYTAADLEVFTKQAAEFRKKSTDLQNQIIAAELIRKDCK